MSRLVRITGLLLPGAILLLVIGVGALNIRPAKASPAESLSRPDDTAALFDDKCAKCHGKDGRAKTMTGKMKHARDFTDAAWQDSVSDEHLINSVTNGKQGMPAYGSKLTEPQIAALITYIRTFKGATQEK